MSVELLQTLSLVSYVLAGLCFLIAVALFFLLGVPKLFGDITGSNARKAIENIRQQNVQTGTKTYKSSAVNLARGKVTDKMTLSGRLNSKNEDSSSGFKTEKISTFKLAPDNNETTLLDNTSNETTVLNEQANETTVLSNADLNNDNATTVLQQNSFYFVIENELSFIASDEIIE